MWSVFKLKDNRNPIIMKDIDLDKDRLAQYGEKVGELYKGGKKVNIKRFLLNRLDDNFKAIETIYLDFNRKADKELPKGTEWLLDNFYIIELIYKQLKFSLKEEQSIKVRIIERGPLKGYPLIYILALELISHTGGKINEENIKGFINGFQKEEILILEEIYYLPTFLALGLIEYIRDISSDLIDTYGIWERIDEAKLDEWEALLEEVPNMDSREVERLIRKIRKKGEDFIWALEALDKKLNYIGTNIKTILEREYIRQSKYKLSLGYGINSLRDIFSLDWDHIFNLISMVENIFKEDPLGVYTNMDSSSKAQYRYEIQVLAEKFKVQEIFLSKKVLELAQREWNKGCRDKRAHVGYYILDKGRKELFEFFKSRDKSHGVYLGKYGYYYFPIILLWLFVACSLALYGYSKGSVYWSMVIFIIVSIPLLTISTNFVNYLFSKKHIPKLLPKLDFKTGIPEEYSTLVVIPTLLPSIERVEDLFNNLEVYYLSNREENIYFGIIGDFKDGNSESTPTDQQIVNKAIEMAQKLNNKYGRGEEIFYYFHRKRTYSETQSRWMGWERKRGALVELNQLLSGEKNTSFSTIHGNISNIQGKIKYIITLDADTKLPIDGAKKLIGTIAHPLNKAVLNQDENRVIEGYGIIQPRILVDIESSNKSLFTRIFAGIGGIDPYSTATFDIYQDLFGEGIFTGKGIYDLIVFQKCLDKTIPEGAVLSHDLLEGSYVRAGLATDIALIDGYPEKYNSYIMRQHRWVRGDWQLIRWLKKPYKNHINSLSRWKILDNMRRSLLPISLFLTIFLGLIFFPGNIFIWLGLSIATLFLPIINMAIEAILCNRFRFQKIKLNGNLIIGYRTYLYQGILSLIFLPHEARMMLDAIVRTLYRVFVSNRNLLEWTTAFDMEKSLDNSLFSYIKRMSENIILSLLLILATYLYNPDRMWLAGIVALLWLIGPVVAYNISQEDMEDVEVSQEDIKFLLEIGRKTWNYYKNFTDEKNNYLPPDNFQEYPYNGVANRTSPTNIGFYLLAILSSRDLGFITTREMIDSIDLTISTIEKMEKWEGHLFNWYNTETLEPLRPIFVSTVDSGNLVSHLITLKEGLKEYLAQPPIDGEIEEKLILKATDLVYRIERLVDNTKFSSLYDDIKDLFYIGYNVEENKPLRSYYDLLASEARISSYIAISRGEVPLEHWSRLGKSLILEKEYISLASWSGTMFEYLMPVLVMKNYKNTLLDESYNTSIRAQMEYVSTHNIPWGISESGFFAFDNQLNYQYKAFGIPALGFKRGLKDELVISPYSSFLALKFNYKEAIKNIRRLKEEGLEGAYGFYEAIDYTSWRLPNHMDKGVIKSYMSHHQGMIFVSINNFLNHDVMVNRFHRDPQMKCGELLLQEKVPLNLIISKEKENLEEVKKIPQREFKSKSRVYSKSELSQLKCHILASNTYSVMINNRGEGFSKNQNIFINRWRRDYLSTPYGQFIYIKDMDNNIWSTTYAPVYKEPDIYDVEFSNYKATFYRKDGQIESKMDIYLLPEELGEIRRVILKNNGDNDVILETTSYFEITGSTFESDLAHTAFNNLFIKTEVLEEEYGLLSHRRKKGDGLEDCWIVHGIKNFDEEEKNFKYETSRSNFVSRGNSLKKPKGILKGLTNTVGVVLDPIMSLNTKIKLQPKEEKEVYFITALTNSRQEAIDILDKYSTKDNIKMALDLSRTKSQTEIGYLNLNHQDIEFYGELLPYLFYIDKNIKSPYKNILKRNVKGKEGLWAQGISGDNPIVLVTIKSMEGIETISKLVDAHEYWSYRGLKVDLVILNEDDSIYYQPLFENIREIVYSKRGNVVDIPGGIFIKNKNILTEEDESLLYKWARLIIKAEQGIIVGDKEKYDIPYKEFKREPRDYPISTKALDLDYFNGYGGFSNGGKEYIIRLTRELNTPLPWVNVIGNKEFGFIVDELGTGFSWCQNSRENKLIPWYNDPLIAKSGEIIYIMDEDTGEMFSITPYPIRDDNDYIITHGLGYTSFYHESHGMEQNLTMFTPMNDNIKISMIRLKNQTDRERNLSLVYYIRPVLGVTDEETENLLESGIEGETMFIKNSSNTEFKDSTIFIGSSEKLQSYSGDRREFLGNIPSYDNPEGLKRERLSNTVGVGYNPCGVIKTNINIPPKSERELVFLLGEGKDLNKGVDLLNKYRNVQKAKETLVDTKCFWNRLLSKIQIKTPDRTMDYMMNNWLMYQTIVCRIWGRAGFYQVGGAFGARDQMQDTINALYHLPEKTRKQIIRNCKHQYKEGDIQHWWHPIPGSKVHKGIRSRYSDDLLWLPLGVAEYILVTGDYSILEEKVPFIESPILIETEYERYEVPKESDEVGTVYEHCIRAIEKSMNFGERGLPLIGGGDWNDGMNKIGYKGKGESVWLAWFLATVLKAFIPVCEIKGDLDKAKRYTFIIQRLKDSIENNAWDGEWYKRAFFDDGSPIGSKENSQCRIDSIAQSWAVISSLGDDKRAKRALAAVEKYLVDKEAGIVALLTPPFDNPEQNPGYIKAYVPGIRENGGQYTHAATWVIKAFAMLGEGDKAYRLFSMINPINHSRTSIECATYKVEPYVVAADVYTNPQHLGRGGWTWYTGSSGWMYRVGLEDILGFRVEKDKLFIDPCIPKDWEGFSIRYKYKNTEYNIEVKNPHRVNRGVNSIIVDGVFIEEECITLIDDGVEHFVAVELGNKG